MNLEQDVSETENDPWKVSVEHKRKQCGRADKVVIVMDAVGKEHNKVNDSREDVPFLTLGNHNRIQLDSLFLKRKISLTSVDVTGVERAW